MAPKVSQRAAATKDATVRTKIFGGLLTRREGWHLSWRAWLLILIVVVSAGWIFVCNAYSFLAVDSPVDTDVLAVEGWIQNYAIRAAADQFKQGHYRMVCSTGGPIAGMGGYTNDFNTVASVGAEQLIAYGIPRELVHAVPSHESTRDRTYGSALALKQWLRDNSVQARAINVATETTHARRTWLLFQEALGPEIHVGIIPLMNPDFDSRRWWQYSEGVRDVLGESIAYLYARFIFSPH